MSCKNKGCNGHARRGQYFCYDCYTAWQQGGDDAVAKRIAEMRKGDQELEDLRLTLTRVKEFVLGPKEFMGATVLNRDYSDLALWERLGRDKQLLIKLRKAHRDATGANPKGLSLAARNDRLWAWLEDQLHKANTPTLLGGFQIHGNRVNGQHEPIVLETLRLDVRPSYGKACCSDCGMPCYLSQRGCPKAPHGPQCYGLLGCPAVPVKLCKHPSAKVKDEAESLRLKVAELEGRLSLYRKREAKQGAATCFSIVLATVAALTGIVAYFTK